MQKILPRGEIENFEHSMIPKVKLPVKSAIFHDRATRLRNLAHDQHPMKAYLELMATVVHAQHQLLQTLEVPPADAADIERSYTHSMPIYPITLPPVVSEWRHCFDEIVQSIHEHTEILPALGPIIERMHALSDHDLQTMAAAVLYDAITEPEDFALAPFVTAALQVYWVARAAVYDVKDFSPTPPFGVCPLCGGHPVASIIHTGGAYQGYRYLHCGICATEWHLVRVTCSHCESTKGIHFHYDEEKPAAKVESCDECSTYRKIFYTEHDIACDPVADDLATLELDAMAADLGLYRVTGNPFLWLNRPS